MLAHQDRNKQASDPKTNFEDRDPTDTHKEETNESIYEAFEEGQYVPKISDMGLGKQLMGQSSFGLSTLGNASAGLAASGAGGQSKDVAGAGPGSVGWQAPEVMAQRRLPEGRALSMSLTRTCSDAGGANPSYDNPTGELIDSSPMEVDLPTAAVRTSRSVDIFSLGCIFYCTIIPGSHPFGEWYEREANIMKNEPNTIALEKISAEASDLVCSMIARNPKQRPTAAQVCLHPFFWDAGRRLAFLCQLSDRLEATSPTLTDSSDASVQQHTNVDPFLVERNAATVVGTSWDKNLDQGLLSNVSRFRTYDPSSVRDLLRLIRNKYHHFDELPDEVKMRLGPNPTDLITYFERVFPGLVMHCFRVCRDNLAEDDPLVHKFNIPSRLGTGTSPSSSAAPNRMSADDARQSELPITIDANVSLDDTYSTTSPSNKDAGTPKNASYYKLLASTQSSLTATLLSSIPTGIVVVVRTICCSPLVRSPLAFLLSHGLYRPRGAICILAATCLRVRTISFRVNQLTPAISFALLNTELHGTMGEYALLLPTHGTVRALRRVPMITQPRSKFWVGCTTSYVRISLSKCRIYSSHPFILGSVPTSAIKRLGCCTSFPNHHPLGSIAGLRCLITAPSQIILESSGRIKFGFCSHRNGATSTDGAGQCIRNLIEFCNLLGHLLRSRSRRIDSISCDLIGNFSDLFYFDGRWR